ncbi:beta-galactosidase [Streptomyces sp. NPDC008196]|uniref:beta-galactosidase n=1 Tax=Streptomyces sp. NPDC008196 TaxID=3364819 RepID=UPI0036E1091E
MNQARRGAMRRAFCHTARHRKHIGIIAAVLLVVACLRVPPDDEGSSYYFGTLQSMPGKAREERSKGIQVAEMQISWDRYEIGEGQYSSEYLESVKRELDRFQKAGMLVEVSLGLNRAPSWLYEKYPEAAYVNQHAERFTETPNMVFSLTVREKAQDYLDKLDKVIGLENFWAIRVGVSTSGEFTYPSARSGHPEAETNYWAFDTNAQSRDRAGRPTTVPANPSPGWKPGQRTYQGKAFTKGQVGEWYDWYLRALSDSVNWQISYYRSLGYDGFLKLLVPGMGYYPPSYRRAVSSYLDETADSWLVAIGAGFYKTLGQIRDRRNVQIVPTSLVDGTGEPRNNGCSPDDHQVDVLAPSRQVQTHWSSMRWISRIARHYDFALLNGESAGAHVSPYYPGVMAQAAHQMKSCGLQGLMWAFARNLYDGTPGSSLEDYSAVMSRYN